MPCFADLTEYKRQNHICQRLPSRNQSIHNSIFSSHFPFAVAKIDQEEIFTIFLSLEK